MADDETIAGLPEDRAILAYFHFAGTNHEEKTGPAGTCANEKRTSP